VCDKNVTLNTAQNAVVGLLQVHRSTRMYPLWFRTTGN